MSLRGEAAIIGIGELPTQRSTPGRSMLGLLGDAARIAIKDAHIRKEDVHLKSKRYLICSNHYNLSSKQY